MSAQYPNRLINKRELHKLIVATRLASGGYAVKHDIAGEAIVCEVPTLEIAGCIVQALRERALLQLAGELLRRHRDKQMKKAQAKFAKRRR